MATSRACSHADGGMAMRGVVYPRRVGLRRYALPAALLATSIVMPAYAQDEASGGMGDSAGYYGRFYNPSKVSAPSATAPGNEEGAPAQPNLSSQRYLAPDVAGLAYQPGFHGCTSDTRIKGMTGGLRTDLVTGARLPQEQQDRYIRYGLTVGESYSDNVGLDPDDEADSAWVTQVVPSVEACAGGGRIKASLDYQLQALYYAGSDESNEIYNNLSAATTMEVLPGHFFLSADTSYGQTLINPSATFADNNLLRPGNRTSAWVTNISPYWFQSLGPLGQATLRYRYGRTEYGSSDVSDYTLHGAYFNLSNPPTNTQWSYQLNVATQRLERDDVNAVTVTADDDGVTHFDSATLQLGYQLTDSLQLLAMGGVEDDYQADGDVDRWGSAIWNVGFRWASPTNALEAHYGERAFGSSWSLEATHQAPLFDVTVAYEEDTTAAGLNRLNRGNVAAGGSFAGPLAPIRDRGVYVSKRLSATLAFDTERTHITLRGYDESREFLTSDEPDEDVYGADLAVRYQLGVRTTLLPRIRWEHHNLGGDESDIAEIGMGAAYSLTPSSQVSASYSHSWRDGETEAGSYDENLVAAQYSIFF